jgi:hypothetical protein
MEKLGFFQEDTSRLNDAEYRVRSPVTPDAFAALVEFLEGRPLAVGRANVACLRALGAEFGWRALSDACEKSAPGGSAADARLLELEARQLALERSLARWADERRSLRAAVRAREAEVGRLSGRIWVWKGGFWSRLTFLRLSSPISEAVKVCSGRTVSGSRAYF